MNDYIVIHVRIILWAATSAAEPRCRDHGCGIVIVFQLRWVFCLGCLGRFCFFSEMCVRLLEVVCLFFCLLQFLRTAGFGTQQYLLRENL